MEIIHSVDEMQSRAIQLRGKGRVLGLVATMGALHEGHLSLIDLAKEKSDVVIVSIFVNPIQFGPNEDFEKYPRTFEEDVRLCRERGADIIFAPTNEDLYPPHYSTYVNETWISKGLCGVSRPGHFQGVTTVVNILFNVTRPDIAVFGQKDAQQVAVIKKMVKDLRIPVEIVVAPTFRESSGLAMSSRNRYLDDIQRKQASQLYAALSEGKRLVEKGILNVDRIKSEVLHQLGQSRFIRIIYIEIVDSETMQPEKEVRPGKSLLMAAVWIDQTRLIDNIHL